MSEWSNVWIGRNVCNNNRLRNPTIATPSIVAPLPHFLISVSSSANKTVHCTQHALAGHKLCCLQNEACIILQILFFLQTQVCKCMWCNLHKSVMLHINSKYSVHLIYGILKNRKGDFVWIWVMWCQSGCGRECHGSYFLSLKLIQRESESG